MPSDKNVQGMSVQRRITLGHSGVSRPASSAPVARLKGTDRPTYPVYRRGGCTPMKGLFWSSAFGPGPSAGTGLMRWNGLAGQAMSSRKKTFTHSSVPRA